MNTSICNCDVHKIVTKMFLMGTLKNCIQCLHSLSLYNQTRTLKKGTKTLIPLCQRIHIPGVLPPASEQVHSQWDYCLWLNSDFVDRHRFWVACYRYQRQWCPLSGVSPRGALQVEPGQGFSGCGGGGSTVPHLQWTSVISVNQLSQTVQGNPLDPAFQHPRAYTGELIGVEYWQGPPSHPRGTIGGGPITKKRTRTTTRDSRKKTQKTIPPSRMWGQLGSYIYLHRFNFLRKHLFCKNTISIINVCYIL